MNIITYLLLLVQSLRANSDFLISFPKHEYGKPSKELIALYHSGFLDSWSHPLKKEAHHRSPLIKMHIKSKRSCLNVDNIAGLQSIVCRGDQMHMHLNTQISISHWNISNGVTFLVNPHWNCLGNQKAVFLHSEAYRIKSLKELIFNVEIVHPTDVIDEYEFIIRPNNEYHRNRLLYDRVTTDETNQSTDHLNPLNFSYSGTLFDSRSMFNRASRNYLQIFCDNCSITGTTELSAHIRGVSILNKARAIIETGIGSALNLNLNFVVKSVGSFLQGLSWNQNIFLLKLFPWSIPGIFEPDFSFKIDLSSNIRPLAQGESRFEISLNHDFSKVRMNSQDGISRTFLNDSQLFLSANSSSDMPGLCFMGSINFSPAIMASISFFKMKVPLAAVSYSTGFSAAVDTLTGISKTHCRMNSFNLVAFGNFKGSIGHQSRNLIHPTVKTLRHGCIDEIPKGSLGQ